VGIATGVTTVIDAGSTGADDVDDFYQLTRKAATEVYALLNISRVGLIAQNELANMANIDAEAVKQAVNRYPNFIVGLKARMSSSVVGENGITPLARAKAMQQENGGLPLMVHIGNNPPDLDEIADLLTSGDIITHCYNGKPNRILTPSGELKSSISARYSAACALISATAPPASASRWRGGRLLWAFCRTPSAPIFTAATVSTARCARWRW
jgi:dihydroorotase